MYLNDGIVLNCTARFAVWQYYVKKYSDIKVFFWADLLFFARLIKRLLLMFVYSLPLFFSDIGLASPLELLIIALALFGVLLISAPSYIEALPQQDTTKYLLAAWLGNWSLLWVFLPFFILLNTCLYLADTLAKLGFLTVSSWDDVHLMLLLPVVWWVVAIWRCSANTQFKLLAALARLATFLVFFEYGLKLLLRIDYPRLFFGCEELLLDYGSCF